MSPISSAVAKDNPGALYQILKCSKDTDTSQTTEIMFCVKMKLGKWLYLLSITFNISLDYRNLPSATTSQYLNFNRLQLNPPS